MNIAFVSNVVYPFVAGGAQKRIHEIGTRLVQMGHDVTVYGRRFWNGPAEITHSGMTLRAVSPARELYADERRSIPEAIEFSIALLRPLAAHSNEHDVVVASVFPYFSVLASKAATVFRDLPLVTTWHEVWGTYWRSYLGRLAPFGKAVERLTATVPQQPVAVSNVTADRLARLGPPREDITVIPNGIDVASIRTTAPARDGFDVLFVGRLIAEKNADVLLEAFDRVGDDRDVTLGVIGDGPERTRLQARARHLSVTDRVSFLGFLDEYDDVLAQMRAASVFAAPSTREGFGITFLEAMAAGCTVVAAEHPNSAASEVVGDAGFLAEPTVDGITDVLERALDGQRPPEDPTETARDYDWDLVAERAERTYRNAIENTQ